MVFTRRLLIVGLCCTALAWVAGPVGRFLVVLPLLLFAPGYLLEQALALPLPSLVGLRPALWLALSLSLVALLYQWATTLGLVLTLPLLSLLALLCGWGVVWRVWHSTPEAAHEQQHPAPTMRKQAYAAWGALLCVLMLTLWTRFVQISGLVLPAWVDSVHHALLIRVAAEQGQVPYSLHPSMPVENLPYHWGYHVFTAAVQQLSGLSLPQVMLWEGQVLNALHVVTCAALAAALWRRPVAGVAAALAVGLLSIMPAYYVSWGRYTQLTGLLVLPALAIAWHTWLHTASRRWLVALVIMLAGLSMIHFRVLIMTLALLAAITLVWAVRQPLHRAMNRLAGSVVVGVLAMAAAAPWLWVLTITRLKAAAASPQELTSGGSYVTLSQGLLWAGDNRWLVALALFIALWGLLQRSQAVAITTAWVSGLLVLANPWLIGYLLPMAGMLLACWGALQQRSLFVACGVVLLLPNPLLVEIPYTWLITNEVVIISLFLPLSIIIGGGVSMLAARVLQHLPPHWHRAAALGGAAVLSGVALWGADHMRSVINPETVFVRQADTAAIAWVAEHTHPDARFLINATTWFPGVQRGTDGGYWLLTLTGRWISTPPALYTYGPPEYVRDVRERSSTVAQLAPEDPQQMHALYALIAQQQIDYIYLGAEKPLSWQLFADDSRFEKVYEQDGVTIVAVSYQPLSHEHPPPDATNPHAQPHSR